MVKKLLFFLGVLSLVYSCRVEQQINRNEPVYVSDLDSLRSKGKITAVTDFGSTNYFIYRGTPMGFHYELLKSFSEYAGIEVEIIPTNDISRSFELIKKGEADIVAVDMSVESEMKKDVKFTLPVSRSGQVLVQRKPNRWSGMTREDIEGSLINNIAMLAGKTVYVQSGSNAAMVMHRQSSRLGNRIMVIEVPYETEKIIALVARRVIDYAVCDENIARVNAVYYPVIDVSVKAGDRTDLAWAVRKEGSEQLVSLLNEWLQMIKGNSHHAILYSKYFLNESLAQIFRSDYYTLNTGRISPWDGHIQKFSETISWDWRLLAALIYQESRFNPNAVSWAGAHGLMQVLPSTGRNFGVDVTSSPENNIRAGVLYLKYLQDFFEQKIPDENERIKFILAAYNAGEGNILDAMRLAEKNGKNPLIWDNNVAYYLLKKSDPAFYNDPVVQFGYCRGDEPVNFVSQILVRYSQYRSLIP